VVHDLVVEKGKHYSVIFWMKTEGISTNEGMFVDVLGVRIASPRRSKPARPFGSSFGSHSPPPAIPSLCGFAASRQKLLAQFDEALRACRSVTAPVARTVDEVAASLRDRLEQFAEKRRVHCHQTRSPVTCDPEPRGFAAIRRGSSVAAAFPLGRRTGYQV
jgi:hypothetical protein